MCRAQQAQEGNEGEQEESCIAGVRREQHDDAAAGVAAGLGVHPHPELCPGVFRENWIQAEEEMVI